MEEIEELENEIYRLKREILFRGLTILGTWAYGNLSILRQKFRDVDAGTYISNSLGSPFAYQVRYETVSQYIGRKDMNNVDIYEGDFLKDQYNRILLVEWRNYQFCFKAISETNFRFATHITQWFEHDSSLPEIIGNVFENPELVKGSET